MVGRRPQLAAAAMPPAGGRCYKLRKPQWLRSARFGPVGFHVLLAASTLIGGVSPPCCATDTETDFATAVNAGVATSTRNAATRAPSNQPTPVRPWIHPDMPGGVKSKLEAAFDIALDRVQMVGDCAGLFHELGADPLEILKTGLYFPTNVQREHVLCTRSMAQTIVGSAPTWICRNITAYPDEKIAAVLIHEALHHAGLPEDETGRTAKSSGSITRTVEKKCDLGGKKAGKRQRR